jgi:C1A family cysteine protease
MGDFFKYKKGESMKSIKSIRIALGILCLGLTSCLMAETSTHGHGKGHIPSTPEQRQKIEQTWPRVVHAKPNHIGVTRILEHAKKKGLVVSGLTPAKHHEEFIKSVGASPLSDLEYASSDTPLPSSVDNSTLSSFPPIGDQQTEGSCVAWGSTYYQASHEIGMLNGYNNKTSMQNVLSPRWTYNLLNGGVDGGLMPDNAFSLLAQNGAVNIVSFPYVNGDVTSWDLNSQDWIAAISNRLAPAQYVTGIGGDQQNLQAIKELLTNGHVLTFATFIDSWVFTTIPNDPNNPNSPYIGQQACTYLNGSDGGHFMTIIGYDDDLWIDVNGNGQVDSGERGAFLIANSWGTSWGNNGYIWISYDAFLNQSAVAGGPSDNRVAAASGENNYVFSAVPKAQNYTPSLIGQFTLGQSVRNQVSIQAGTSDTSQTAPAQTFDCYALMNQGGALEFDGTQPGDPESATFAVDMTDLLTANNTAQRYYLVTADNTAGNPTVLTAFSLLDVVHNSQVSYPGVPLECDNSQITPYIDYTFASSAQASSAFSHSVNCGGSGVGHKGINYINDKGFSAQSYAFTRGNLKTANPVYKTERNGENFSYNFQVPKGKYVVTLQFAEMIYKQPNKRVFHVNINGSRAITNLDLAALAGFGVPYDLKFPVNAAKGAINVHFVSVLDKAKINGIHIVKVD